jgi:hypothetical protein
MTKVDVDLPAAHVHFSAWCFNQAWELIEMTCMPHLPPYSSRLRWLAEEDRLTVWL